MESCGHELKHQCFYLYEALRNLNHGSFGTVPRDVVEAQREFHIKQESCPELWFREWYMHDINAGRFELAKLINSENDDVVFVENASFAVNSVIASFSFQVQHDINLRTHCVFNFNFPHMFTFYFSLKTWSFALIVPIRW